MQIAVDDTGRLIGYVTIGSYENGIEVESVPPGDPWDYRYVDGKYIYDPIPETEQEPAEGMTMDDMMEIAADHEYRLCMIELGVTEEEIS